LLPMAPYTVGGCMFMKGWTAGYVEEWPTGATQKPMLWRLTTYAHSFPRTSLSENCSLLGTDNVHGQISEHTFTPNEGYCLYIFILSQGVSQALMPITASWSSHIFSQGISQAFMPITAPWSSHIFSQGVSQGDMLLLAVNWCLTCYFTCVIQFQYNSKIISKISHNSSQGWIMLNFFAQIILASQDISRGVSHPEKVHMVFTWTSHTFHRVAPSSVLN